MASLWKRNLDFHHLLSKTGAIPNQHVQVANSCPLLGMHS